jgi:ATP-dependent Lon protease
MELGETVFPEPVVPVADANGKKDTSSTDVPAAATSTDPVDATAAATKPEVNLDAKLVTTQDRKPLKVPESVHVRIMPENLKDYVGPPVYHKDRMYVEAPPPGVSTGLGYLGNGSGAVMPVEASVGRVFSLARA